MVFASILVVSDNLFAARPVGAARRMFAFADLYALMMPSVVVVFPVPGPLSGLGFYFAQLSVLLPIVHDRRENQTAGAVRFL